MPGEITVAQLAREMTAHLRDCYDVRVETKEALKELNERFATLNATAWKAVGAIALVIISAVAMATGTVVTQSWLAQRAATAAAEQAALSVSMNTARNQKQILGKLNTLTPLN